MTLGNFIEGLNILQKYYKKPDGYHLGAEHDIIYCYTTDAPIPEEDLAKLLSLGWHQPEVSPSEEGGDYVVSDYDPEEGWGAFV